MNKYAAKPGRVFGKHTQHLVRLQRCRPNHDVIFDGEQHQRRTISIEPFGKYRARPFKRTVWIQSPPLVEVPLRDDWNRVGSISEKNNLHVRTPFEFRAIIAEGEGVEPSRLSLDCF